MLNLKILTHLQMGPVQHLMPPSKPYQLKRFLKEDVSEHVMAVNNKYTCEYERIQQRDAIVELLDVVQTKNEAKCFKNQYFDKAETEAEVEERRRRES